jgi:hypothetical protein
MRKIKKEVDGRFATRSEEVLRAPLLAEQLASNALNS